MPGVPPMQQQQRCSPSKTAVALRAAAATASLALILKHLQQLHSPSLLLLRDRDRCARCCCCGCCCLPDASVSRSYLDNASTCCLCELQSTHTQLGHLEQAGVVSDSGHDDCDLVLLQEPKPAAAAASAPEPRLLDPLIHTLPPSGAAGPHLAAHELSQLGHGQRGPVCLGHEQALQHHLIEVAVCAPDQEAVELQGNRDRACQRWDGWGPRRCCCCWAPHLDQQLQVHVVALGSGPGRLLVAATRLEIDSLKAERSFASLETPALNSKPPSVQAGRTMAAVSAHDPTTGERGRAGAEGRVWPHWLPHLIEPLNRAPRLGRSFWSMHCIQSAIHSVTNA